MVICIDHLDVLEDAVLAEKKRVPVTSLIVQVEPVLNLVAFSSWTRLLKVTAWIVRFVYNARHRHAKRTGPLQAEEINDAEMCWIKYQQSVSFVEEVQALKATRLVASNSKIANLNPYLAEDGIIRVGGRLQLSNLPHAAKHQVVLPYDGQLVALLIMHVHKRMIHA